MWRTIIQITLNQDEIEMAITNYVRSQISISDNTTIEVDLRAGRGENGFTASLDVRSVLAGAPVAKPVTRTLKPVEVAVAEEPAPAPEAVAPAKRETKADKAPPVFGAAFGKPVVAADPEPVSALEEPSQALSADEAGVPEPLEAPSTGGIFNFAVKN